MNTTFALLGVLRGNRSVSVSERILVRNALVSIFCLGVIVLYICKIVAEIDTFCVDEVV